MPGGAMLSAARTSSSALATVAERVRRRSGPSPSRSRARSSCSQGSSSLVGTPATSAADVGTSSACEIGWIRHSRRPSHPRRCGGRSSVTSLVASTSQVALDPVAQRLRSERLAERRTQHPARPQPGKTLRLADVAGQVVARRDASSPQKNIRDDCCSGRGAPAPSPPASKHATGRRAIHRAPR
jgi:hypothetical protein